MRRITFSGSTPTTVTTTKAVKKNTNNSLQTSQLCKLVLSLSTKPRVPSSQLMPIVSLSQLDINMKSLLRVWLIAIIHFMMLSLKTKKKKKKIILGSTLILS